MSKNVEELIESEQVGVSFRILLKRLNHLFLVNRSPPSEKEILDKIINMVDTYERRLSASIRFIGEDKKHLENRIKQLEVKQREILNKSLETINNQQASVYSIDNILKQFIRYNENISVSMVRTFLAVAMDEGLRMTQYCQKTGFAKSTVSRHLFELGFFKDGNGKGKGMGLIQINNVGANLSLLDKTENRISVIKMNEACKPKKYFSLTLKGKALIEQLKLEKTGSDALVSFVTSLPV